MQTLRWKEWWWSLGLGLLVFVAWKSLTPVESLPVSDKSGHFMVYAVLAGWFCQLGQGWRYWLAVMLAISLFGAAMEGLQGLTDYRKAEGLDVLANTLGAALMTLFLAFAKGTDLLWRLEKRLTRKQKSRV